MTSQEFYELVQSRKSIRQYKSDPVPREVLERIFNDAAFHAPLKYSQKSWLGIKDILQKRLKPSLYDFTERFFFTLGNAPVLVFCYSNNSPEERHYTSIGSVYMAVQNINLACQIEGLGCCTMGAPLEIQKEVDEFLGVTNLPEYKAGELELLCGVVIGYPDHTPPKPPRQTENRLTWLE
jgi:nitroreductase